MDETTDNPIAIFDKILFLWIGSIVALSIAFLIIQFKIQPGQTSLALHYNVVFGVDAFGKGIELYKIPLTGLGITAINYLLYKVLKHQQHFLAFLAALISFVVSLLLLVAVLFLATVN